MKKILALLLALSMVFCFAACTNTPNDEESSTDADSNASQTSTIPEDFKVGFIFLHD